jgi:hypothetical protein
LVSGPDAETSLVHALLLGSGASIGFGLGPSGCEGFDGATPHCELADAFSGRLVLLSIEVDERSFETLALVAGPKRRLPTHGQRGDRRSFELFLSASQLPIDLAHLVAQAIAMALEGLDFAAFDGLSALQCPNDAFQTAA